MEDRLGPVDRTPASMGSMPPKELADNPAEGTAPAQSEASEDERRLDADRKLRDALAAEGFAGPAYSVFEEQLASYGYQLLSAWLATDRIFAECCEVGLRLPRLPIPFADREDLAQETVAGALRTFRRGALLGGRWQPEGGASLKTFFRGALCQQFANIWRRRVRELAVSAGASADSIDPDTESRDAGPEETFLQRDEIRLGLAEIRSRETRITLVLTEYGYQQKEIAEILGPKVTPRAVEGYIRRHRARLENESRAQTDTVIKLETSGNGYECDRDATD